VTIAISSPRARAAPALAAAALVALALPARAGEAAVARAFPSFARTPRVDLVKRPTPLAPLAGLARHLAAPGGRDPWLWMKHDDVADGLVGGNKARKLEFLLGEARALGADTVVTSGRFGTNLGLATAAAARRLGMRATVVLAPAPLTGATRRKVLALHAAGGDIRFNSSLARAVADVAWLRARAALGGERSYYVPPSGTSDVGSMGYVDAFFELLEQTGPERLPDEIVVPAATGGTAAGLLAGSCLAGQWGRTRIVAVGVTDGWLQSEWLLRREARSAFRAVRDALDPADRARVVECDFMESAAALRYVKGYLGPGYGRTDAATDEVLALLRRTDGVELDPTYTGKAMRYFVDRARERLRAGDTRRPLVFWNTYSPVDVERAIAEHRWAHPGAPWRDLPAGFHALFAAAQ
jgi:1-aminocyclopropane-1-carboxylate deaminase/D-cysteine desulfhydrase-like pyridoxal-dependent ACC family enzyme